MNARPRHPISEYSIWARYCKTMIRYCVRVWALPFSLSLLAYLPRASVVDRGSFGVPNALRSTITTTSISTILYGRVLLVPCTDRRFTGVGFPTTLPSVSNTTPTIVHLSIRPYALPSDDPTLSKKKRLGVAIGRRLSTVGVGPGGGGNVEHAIEGEPARRAGCCTGCTIC